ncbi:MAG: glycoside hydrolase family 3, partial [Desulfobulbaceae bacterium]|nr:glycoside hydrolase family 3 [Desulfobulbaceae bacterium]
INFNLAPVVDLDCNPDNPIIGGYERSFSTDPGLVARFADAFIAAHHQQKVACCLKHFPGHGSAGSDSHLGFVDITEHWRQEELRPFSTLFRDGFCDAVMTAHVVQRTLDPSGMPATLSHEIISGMLRNGLGFTGVILTDDLQMRAISDKWGFKEAVQRAVLAGIDMVIVGNNLVRRQDAVEEGIRAVAELLDIGRIDEDRIRASISRINVLKKKITGEIPWHGSQPIT